VNGTGQFVERPTRDKEMIIYLNPHWRIRSDELQWILEHLPDPKPGTTRKVERWKAIAYLTTLDRAVVCCAERQIRLLPMDVGAEALPRLCTALDQIKAEARAAVRGLRVKDLAAE